ncbi:MAG: SAM-dependent methyltransferase [Treponema sp.]|nr:SAM-dependent methyltransferase [Treponema sp.]
MSIYADVINEIIKLPHAGTLRIVLGKPGNEKTLIKPILLKGVNAWQCERIIKGASFHENISEPGFLLFLERLFNEEGFKNITIITMESVITYRVSKKQTLHRSKSENKSPVKPTLTHDKKKNHILIEGMQVQPLVDLGVFTADYKIIKAKYNKFRQINSFLKIIESGIAAMSPGKSCNSLNILEFGCGKSYLTFILYYYFKIIRKIDVKITGYDLNSEIVDYCNGIAKKYGYDDLSFNCGDISEIKTFESKPDIIITLHACDTATDKALYNAVTNKVKYIFCVPCCQKELNQKIKSKDELSLLLRYGLIKERFSALLTDTIRCELLAGEGYAVDLVEFVGEENTPKNIMIRARYSGFKKDNAEKVKKLLLRFDLEQTLFNLIKGNKVD